MARNVSASDTRGVGDLGQSLLVGGLGLRRVFVCGSAENHGGDGKSDHLHSAGMFFLRWIGALQLDLCEDEISEVARTRALWNSRLLAQIPSEKAKGNSGLARGAREPGDSPPAVESGEQQGDDSQGNRGPDEVKKTDDKDATSEKPKESSGAQPSPSKVTGSSNPPAGKSHTSGG